MEDIVSDEEVLSALLQSPVLDAATRTSMLMYGIVEGREPIVEAMLSSFSPDTLPLTANGDSLLVAACTAAQNGIAIKIATSFPHTINQTCENGQTALHVASGVCSDEVVQHLLSHGADVNAREKFGNTPLHFAAAYGRVSIMQLLVAHGADVFAKDQYANTALCPAIQNSHFDAVVYLLPSLSSVRLVDQDGKTPLHHAARFDMSGSILQVLLDEGFGVNVADEEGCLPLHYACCFGNVRTELQLLNSRSNVNAHNNEGRTPLHDACISGGVDVIAPLLNAGAELNAIDEFGRTPLHKACCYSNRAAAICLIENGANVDMNGHNARYYSNFQVEFDRAINWRNRCGIVVMLESSGFRDISRPLPREACPAPLCQVFCNVDLCRYFIDRLFTMVACATAPASPQLPSTTREQALDFIFFRKVVF